MQRDRAVASAFDMTLLHRLECGTSCDVECARGRTTVCLGARTWRVECPHQRRARLEEAGAWNPGLALLLAAAMFVLVFDTSLMNVSISAVITYLNTTVSGVQSAIALEALVSAAFILIMSKVGDLIGRKRGYVIGLLGYAVGALAMAARTTAA